MPIDPDMLLPLDRLSDKHREVLRGVAQHKSSKQIARELGISPHTVDQRIKRVTILLNVHSRFEAARLYMAWKRDQPLEGSAGLLPDQPVTMQDNAHGAAPPVRQIMQLQQQLLDRRLIPRLCARRFGKLRLFSKAPYFSLLVRIGISLLLILLFIMILTALVSLAKIYMSITQG